MCSARVAALLFLAPWFGAASFACWQEAAGNLASPPNMSSCDHRHATLAAALRDCEAHSRWCGGAVKDAGIACGCRSERLQSLHILANFLWILSYSSLTLRL